MVCHQVRPGVKRIAWVPHCWWAYPVSSEKDDVQDNVQPWWQKIKPWWPMTAGKDAKRKMPQYAHQIRSGFVRKDIVIMLKSGDIFISGFWLRESNPSNIVLSQLDYSVIRSDTRHRGRVVKSQASVRGIQGSTCETKISLFHPYHQCSCICIWIRMCVYGIAWGVEASLLKCSVCV